MKTFEFYVNDALGIHARSALMLGKESSKYKSKINIKKGSQVANVKGIMNLMILNVKCNDKIEFYIEGIDEEEALYGIKKYCERNL